MEQGTGREQSNRKSWLAQHWVATAAGVFVGIIAGATFLVMGLAAWKAGTTDVGVGYFVTAGVAPLAIIAVAMRFWTD